MIHYNFPSTTFSDAVSDAAPDTPFSVSGAPAEAILSFLLVSDQPFHFQLNADATTDASPYVPAATPVSLTMYGSDHLSYISATGGAAGTLWVTRIA
jgi:hypothetical protein